MKWITHQVPRIADARDAGNGNPKNPSLLQRIESVSERYRV